MQTELRELIDGILNNPDDEQMKKLAITAAASDGQTSHATGALIASEFYLANTLKRSLTEHADALNKSAEATEKHARSLTWATWALVGATIILAIVAGIQTYLTYLSLGSMNR